MEYGIVYKITNKINGMSYIGQTIKTLAKRKNEHKQDMKRLDYLLQRSLRKFGWNSFKWEILEECNSRKELDEMEFHYIKQYNTYWRDNGYNLTLGGEGSYERTKEIRKKMSKTMKEQYKNGRKGFWYGKKLSEETKKKISENHADVSGENNPGYGKSYWKGRPHTKETRKKMSEKAKQRKRDKNGRFI